MTNTQSLCALCGFPTPPLQADFGAGENEETYLVRDLCDPCRKRLVFGQSVLYTPWSEWVPSGGV